MIAKSIVFKNPDLFKLISKVYSESMKVEVFQMAVVLEIPALEAGQLLVRAAKMAYRIQGGEPYTTNNRMEMLGSIWGIKTAMAEFPDFTEISVTTDSALIVDTMNKNWKKKKNQDLWEELANLIKGHKVTWHWVRGHNGLKKMRTAILALPPNLPNKQKSSANEVVHQHLRTKEILCFKTICRKYIGILKRFSSR